MYIVVKPDSSTNQNGFCVAGQTGWLPSERAVVYARDAVSLLKTVTNNCWHTPLFLFHAHNQHRFLQAKYTLNETDSCDKRKKNYART